MFPKIIQIKTTNSQNRKTIEPIFVFVRLQFVYPKHSQLAWYEQVFVDVCDWGASNVTSARTDGTPVWVRLKVAAFLFVFRNHS